MEPVIGQETLEVEKRLVDKPSDNKPDDKTTITKQYESGKLRYVYSQSATVRCGPAKNYYATSKLARGSAVDVYIETSDGWSGIRPSAESHNWIPSDVVYLLPGSKTAEVIADSTPAWVGSDNDAIKNFLWQTELVKSQQVQILGEAYQGEGDDKKLWFRIAPPQGEFRWMLSQQLSDTMPRSTPIPDGIKTTTPLETELKSDGLVQKNAIPLEDEGVQSAQYVERTDRAKSASGNIVWSDEQDQIARVEQEIRQEQNQIIGQMASEGVVLDTAPDELDFVVSDDGKPIRALVGGASPRKKSGSKKSAGAHQTDSFQHWDTMQANKNPKLKVGPMASVLGLIGLGVAEAERIPTNSPNPRQLSSTRNKSFLHYDPGQAGGMGTSRLDRLPRPVRRSTDGALSSLLESQEPLFGGTAAINESATAGINNAPGLPNNYDSGWYGISPEAKNTYVGNQGDPPLTAYDPGLANSTIKPPEDDREFTTPEIQQSLLVLTDIVALPTERWNFGELHRQTTHWIEHGSDAIARGEARLLLERIERFESLRQRTLGFAQNQSQIASQSSLQPAIASSSNTNLLSVAPAGFANNPNANIQRLNQTPPTTSTTNPSGNASGWLVQVHTSVPGQPEFALTDDAGNVITYVQPTAGLNLRRYLQQPVSIMGVRGYIPNLAAKQILAERVVRIR